MARKFRLRIQHDDNFYDIFDGNLWIVKVIIQNLFYTHEIRLFPN